MTDQPVEVTAEQSPFAMVPHWILSASGNAVKLYAVLTRYSNRRTKEAWPSRQRLAEDMGMKQAKSLDPIIRELEEMGAMVVSRTKGGGRNAPNVYHMLFSKPKDPQNVVVPENGLFSESDETIVRSSDRNSPVQRQRIVPCTGPELRTKNYNQELDESAAVADAQKSPEDQIAQRAYDATKGALGYMPVRQIAKWAIKAGYAPPVVEGAIKTLWDNGKPLTKILVGQTLEGIVRPGQERKSKAELRRENNLAVIDRMRELDDADMRGIDQ